MSILPRLGPKLSSGDPKHKSVGMVTKDQPSHSLRKPNQTYDSQTDKGGCSMRVGLWLTSYLYIFLVTLTLEVGLGRSNVKTTSLVGKSTW